MIEIQDLEGAHFNLPRASVPAGELVAVVAPTTACAREFVDLLLGVAKPRKGSVGLFGTTVAWGDELARQAVCTRLGYAGRGHGLVNHLALWENILLGAAYHHRRSASSLDARVRTLLEWCAWPVEEARAAFLRDPDEVGPFELAAAAWLRALVGDPEILVFEDLLAGLSLEQRGRLIEASAMFMAEDPRRAAVFVLVGDRFVDELQPTSMVLLSLKGDFKSETAA